MYRNHSLNVTADKERWVEGSKGNLKKKLIFNFINKIKKFF